MPKDLTVVMEDRMGQLAMLSEALGKAKVNVLGGCGITSMGRGTIHLLFDDKGVDAAKRALQQAGITVKGEQDFLVQKVADQPGRLGKFDGMLADSGGIVILAYLATTHIVAVGYIRIYYRQ